MLPVQMHKRAFALIHKTNPMLPVKMHKTSTPPFLLTTMLQHAGTSPDRPLQHIPVPLPVTDSVSDTKNGCTGTVNSAVPQPTAPGLHPKQSQYKYEIPPEIVVYVQSCIAPISGAVWLYQAKPVQHEAIADFVPAEVYRLSWASMPSINRLKKETNNKNTDIQHGSLGSDTTAVLIPSILQLHCSAGPKQVYRFCQTRRNPPLA